MNEKQFTRRLKTILQDNNVSRRNEREKSGMINTKRVGLYGTTERIFAHRDTEKLEKEYSISLLLDTSGSMRGDEIGLASQCVNQLAHAIGKINGIKLEIVTFSASEIQLKGFDEKPPDKDELFDIAHMLATGGASVRYYYSEKTGDLFDSLRGHEPEGDYRLLSSEPWHGENYDQIAILRAYQRLKNRSGKKIILTFSDGEPTKGDINEIASRPGVKTLRGDKKAIKLLQANDPSHSFKQLSKEIGQDTEVDMIGIGINTNAVKRYYEYNTAVYHLEELYPETVRILNKVIKKS